MFCLKKLKVNILTADAFKPQIVWKFSDQIIINHKNMSNFYLGREVSHKLLCQDLKVVSLSIFQRNL